jgi:hypothetical protein
MGLMPMLAAYPNFFPFFSSYVGFVPVSNLLAIFVSDGGCEFLSMFCFMTEKKTSFGWKVLVGPRSTKTFYVLVLPKVTYQNFIQLPFSAMLLGLSILQIFIII